MTVRLRPALTYLQVLQAIDVDVLFLIHAVVVEPIFGGLKIVEQLLSDLVVGEFLVGATVDLAAHVVDVLFHGVLRVRPFLLLLVLREHVELRKNPTVR